MSRAAIASLDLELVQFLGIQIASCRQYIYPKPATLGPNVGIICILGSLEFLPVKPPASPPHQVVAVQSYSFKQLKYFGRRDRVQSS